MGTMTSMATEMTKSLFYQASWGLTRKFAGQCGSVRVSKKKINEINDPNKSVISFGVGIYHLSHLICGINATDLDSGA